MTKWRKYVVCLVSSTSKWVRYTSTSHKPLHIFLQLADRLAPVIFAENFFGLDHALDQDESQIGQDVSIGAFAKIGRVRLIDAVAQAEIEEQKISTK